MSPIAGTRSSKPSSPTSSTVRWRTCRRGASGRTPRGCSARRSPTICCAPPVFLQVVGMFAPVGRRYAARSSTFPPGCVDRNENRSCGFPRTGPGRAHGFDCGPIPSVTARQLSPEHRPTRRDGTTGTASWKSWADQRSPHVRNCPYIHSPGRNGLRHHVSGFRLRISTQSFAATTVGCTRRSGRGRSPEGPGSCLQAACAPTTLAR